MRKFYITTAIDYVNDKPHLGHALEKVQADVIARYHRLKGDDVFFLTGTDEHGQKIARAAKGVEKEPQKFVDEVSEKFRSLKDALNLSYNDFIRTSDKERHWPGAVNMWRELMLAGAIYKKNYKGFYCVGHEAFITEKELIDGKCPDHGKEPEIIEEENYFFKLSEYGSRIKEKIESDEFQIIPESRKNEILSLIDRGLEDISFSRSAKNLEWGIPVPDDSDQVMYVWCDALTNYLSAIGYGQNDDYKKWWPADVQVIGKDILRFHAAIWPAMLLAAGLELPQKLFVHGFITVDGKKMSKTIGNVLDPVEFIEKLVQRGVPRESAIDALRYYLLREIPSTEDGDFSEEKFIERYNADLANGLGNLVSRVMKMAGSFGAKLKKDEVGKIEGDITNLQINEMLLCFNFAHALEMIMGYFRQCDIYIQEKEPYKLEGEQGRFHVEYLMAALYRDIEFLEPFLPATSKKIFDILERGLEVKNPLFPRIS